jgi:hypothetical protein
MDDRTSYDPPLDFHDPTAGIAGAPPAASALTLRAVLAGGALLTCLIGIAVTIIVGGPTALVAVLAIVAATSVIDIVVIATRLRRDRIK